MAIRWIENASPGPAYTPVTAADARAALDFWRGAPFYEPTPLVSSGRSAHELGLGAIYIKDESRRFGLNAFKALGAGYAMARALPGGGTLDYGAAAGRGGITFFTATDGNHGCAVAHFARLFGCRARVLMPEHSSPERFAAIAREGASVTVEPMNYDDCVRRARALAEENGGVLLQDTALPGYEALPLEIMRGYGAMAAELAEQLDEPPTHVVLQAGVGSFSGALASALTELWPGADMTILVCEAEAAPCLLLSIEAGGVRTVGGELRTIMAGLACGEPCLPGLKSLAHRARFFAALPDERATDAMRALAREGVVAGESGAAGFGLLRAVMLDAGLEPLRARAGLDRTSRVLVFNTEGATDRENYRAVVGNFPARGNVL